MVRAARQEISATERKTGEAMKSEETYASVVLSVRNVDGTEVKTKHDRLTYAMTAAAETVKHHGDAVRLTLLPTNPNEDGLVLMEHEDILGLAVLTEHR